MRMLEGEADRTIRRGAVGFFVPAETIARPQRTPKDGVGFRRGK